jgi:hypothetical protein
MKLGLMIAIAVSTAGCTATWNDAPPPPAHGCAVHEVTCMNANLQPTGMCCPQGFICGGPSPNVGCGGQMCCFVGTRESKEDDGKDDGESHLAHVHHVP